MLFSLSAIFSGTPDEQTAGFPQPHGSRRGLVGEPRLSDRCDMSPLLGILLQETKRKTSTRHQDSARQQFPQIPVPTNAKFPRSALGPGERWGEVRSLSEEGEGRPLHSCAFLSSPTAPCDPAAWLLIISAWILVRLLLQLPMGESSPGEPSAPIIQLRLGKDSRGKLRPEARAPLHTSATVGLSWCDVLVRSGEVGAWGICGQ